jgi:hypothetical protein
MSDPTPYEQIRYKVGTARRLFEQGNADLTYGYDQAADAHFEAANVVKTEAELLIDEHRPKVRHNTVQIGEMRALEGGLDWVRVYDPATGQFASVRWDDIDGEVTA